MVKASLQNYRISPRKARLVADQIRGKSVSQARVILTHASKRAKHPLTDLLASAVANAKNNFKLDDDTLFVKSITVGQGLVMKRFMPVSRGSAHGFKKRTSHIDLVLATRESKVKKSKVESRAKTNK